MQPDGKLKARSSIVVSTEMLPILRTGLNWEKQRQILCERLGSG